MTALATVDLGFKLYRQGSEGTPFRLAKGYPVQKDLLSYVPLPFSISLVKVAFAQTGPGAHL